MDGHAVEPPTYSVVIPVYNSGPALADLVERIVTVFNDDLGDTVEIILVDDASPNGQTRALVCDLAARAEVVGIRLMRNYGKHGAVMCGLAHSRGEWVVTIDDDGQQRPEDIPALVAMSDHDVVIATHGRKQHSLTQRATSRIKQQFDRWVLGYDFPLSPLKLLHRRVVDGMLEFAGNRLFVPALIRDITDDVVPVAVEHQTSSYAASRYTFAKRWRQFLNLVIGNSAFFMHVFLLVGLTVMLLSLLLATVVLIRALLGIPNAAGWSSLMIAILLLGGLNLGAMGVVGQYYLRILDTTSRKPAYRVRDIVGRDARS